MVSVLQPLLIIPILVAAKWIWGLKTTVTKFVEQMQGVQQTVETKITEAQSATDIHRTKVEAKMEKIEMVMGWNSELLKKVSKELEDHNGEHSGHVRRSDIDGIQKSITGVHERITDIVRGSKFDPDKTKA